VHVHAGHQPDDAFAAMLQKCTVNSATGA
jgi:hypothetical protein